MTTPNGSANDSGKVETIRVSELEKRLGIGSAAEVRELVDYSKMMEIVMETIPDTVEVRWVGINNAQQIERHLMNGYTYVEVTDGIKTLTGLEKTDASGRYVVVGDCVLMACSKEALKARRKELAKRTRQRLETTIQAGEFKEAVRAKGIKLYEDDERAAEMKS